MGARGPTQPGRGVVGAVTLGCKTPPKNRSLRQQCTEPALAVDGRGTVTTAWTEETTTEPYFSYYPRIKVAWKPRGGSWQGRST